ncbi:uncharacterized protein CcaverHIS019_0408170 [Cutaneotrichosporon cavernicola]|uniref:Uncharacterized protein n=1 Tax=Cutaneotrichosporon cavernicola TaxID=279322 RepID=A0AA48QWB6_9TREE|nr:uncharacterized protein CcaverHIS019_0408170 [Cutaneotrichosporon cavernicola]BEI91997.1 hypothetical protein CcaverHIS019_0408170 [Cutaneotrichosporon cavernicola]
MDETHPRPVPLTEALVLASLEVVRTARRAATTEGHRATALHAAALSAFNPTTIASGAAGAVDAAVESFKARCAATLAECGALNKENIALRAVVDILLAGDVSDEAKTAFEAYLAPGGRM